MLFRYLLTIAALGLIGVSEEETLALFRSLAGVLYLGQVQNVVPSVYACVRVCVRAVSQLMYLERDSTAGHEISLMNLRQTGR